MPVPQETFDQAAAGSESALRLLLEHYGPMVRARIAQRVGRQWQALIDPDDVMQVSYLEAFFSLERLTARSEASFVAWLSRIAENNLHDARKALESEKRPDHLRRAQPFNADDSHGALLDFLRGSSTTPSRQLARHESRRIVSATLEQLPSDYRTVVRLYDLEGRPSDEIARVMGRSVGAVLMLRARAHERMKGLLHSQETL